MTIYPNIILYCAQECERQHAGPLAVYDMVTAWQFADFHRKALRNRDLLDTLQRIAGNVDDRNRKGYRTSHVGFVTGGSVCPVDEIAGRMERLFELPLLPPTFDSPWAKAMDADVQEHLCKSILQIHPWIDGNGRTVSIFRNLLRGTLDEPEALPYYFGE